MDGTGTTSTIKTQSKSLSSTIEATSTSTTQTVQTNLMTSKMLDNMKEERAIAVDEKLTKIGNDEMQVSNQHSISMTYSRTENTTNTENVQKNNSNQKSQGGNISPHKRKQQPQLKKFFIERVAESNSLEKNGESIVGNEIADQHFLETELPKLRAIIYAEFDNEIGRVIRYQIPNDIFDKQHFDSISSAVIPSEEMRNRMIKINMFEHKIIGFPVAIKNKRYAREVLIFNMCFIVAKQTSSDWVYEPLVAKCAEYLIELEQERQFLSEQKHRLPELMAHIFNDLNEKNECIYTVTEQTSLYLRLCPSFRSSEPPSVNQLHVPIYTHIPPPNSIEFLNRMDVLSQKVCPKIDGVRCIKDIASIVQIDTDLVARCVQNLCYYGFAKLLPIFLYSNCYVPTDKIRHFINSPKIQKRCLDFIQLDQTLPNSTPVRANDIFRLYLALKHGQTLKDWFNQMRPRELGIDERKLIQFGVHYGFLRKMQIYPVVNQQQPDCETTKIGSMCNGECSLEELALHYGCSPIELHRCLVESGNFRFIWR